MKYSFLLICALFGYSGLVAQPQKSNQQFKSSGNIPSDFLGLSSDKYLQDRMQGERGQSKNEKKRLDRFYLESSFYVDRILHSGFVTFNDPVYIYINKVADKVLAHDPELRSKLRFYPVKFNSVNAFVVDRGIVFINIGLIARLDNEAQLAFVISHEVSHYLKKHNVKFYLENKKIAKREGEYSDLASDQQIVASSRYSKANELEADQEAMNLLFKSDYDPNYSMQELHKLLYAGQPIQDLPFRKSFFESGYFHFPSLFFVDSVDVFYPEELREADKKIKALDQQEEDEEDDENTHPSVTKRKERIQTLLDKKTVEGKRAFLLSEDEFKEIRKLCCLELCRSMMLEGRYVDAIYQAYLLLNEYPDNLYLKTTIAQSLTKLSAFIASGMRGEVLPASVYHVKGAQQRLYRLLGSLSNEDLSALAFRYCWSLHKANPSDSLLLQISIMNLKRLVRLQPDLKLYGQATEFSDSLIDTWYPIKINTSFKSKAVSSETEKRSFKKTKDEQPERQVRPKQGGRKRYFKKQPFAKSFSRFVLADWLDDKELMSLYDKYATLYKAEPLPNEDEELDEDEERRLARKKRREQRNSLEPSFFKKIILVDPEYMIVDQRKENPVNLLASENSIDVFHQSLLSSAQEVGVELSIVNPKTFEAGDVELYNELCVMKNWMDESFTHDSLSLPATDGLEMKKIAQKYNTRYIGLVKAVSITGKWRGDELLGRLILCVVFPILLPVIIPPLLVPDRNLAMAIVVLDTQENKLKYFSFSYTKKTTGHQKKIRRIFRRFFKETVEK